MINGSLNAANQMRFTSVRLTEFGSANYASRMLAYVALCLPARHYGRIKIHRRADDDDDVKISVTHSATVHVPGARCNAHADDGAL